MSNSIQYWSSLPSWQRDGLELLFPFHKNDEDVSPQNESITSTGSIGYASGPYPGVFSKCFNGVSTYNSTDLSSSYIGAVTFSAWVYFSEDPSWGVGVFPRIIGNLSATSPSAYAGIEFLISQGTTARQVYFQGGKSGSAVIQRFSSSNVSAGWNHWAATWPGGSSGGSDAHIYLNGILNDGTASGAGPLQAPTSTSWNIGRCPTISNTYIPSYGRLFDVRLYTRVLTAEEIYQLYKWKFRQVSRPLIFLPSADISLALSGLSSSTGIGTLIPNRSIALTSVDASTLSVGPLTVDYSVSLTSTPSVTDVGTIVPSFTIPISGVSETSGVGSVTYNSDGSISLELSGVQSALSIGSVTPSFDITLSGISLTGSVGDVSLATSISGVEGTGSTGDLGMNLTIALTGIFATGYLGNVVASGGDSSGSFVGGVSHYRNTDGVSNKTHDSSGNETSSVSRDKTDSVTEMWWING